MSKRSRLEREARLTGLELIGSQKARHAIAGRLAGAIAYALGAVGVTMHLTTQDGEADPKTNEVTFTTQTHIQWTQHLGVLDQESQEKIVLAHLRSAVKADERQVLEFGAQFEAAAKHRSELAAKVEAQAHASEPCKDCPPEVEEPHPSTDELPELPEEEHRGN